MNGMPGGGFGPPVLGGAGAKMARSGASVRKRASQVNTIASIGSSVATAIGGDGGIAQAAPALLEAAIKLLEFANGRDSNGYSFR